MESGISSTKNGKKVKDKLGYITLREMNTSGEIPAALIIEAKKYGVYNLSCIGKYDNVSVYIQKREEHPSRPIYPTGLPTLFYGMVLRQDECAVWNRLISLTSLKEELYLLQ